MNFKEPNTIEKSINDVFNEAAELLLYKILNSKTPVKISLSNVNVLLEYLSRDLWIERFVEHGKILKLYNKLLRITKKD